MVLIGIFLFNLVIALGCFLFLKGQISKAFRKEEITKEVQRQIDSLILEINQVTDRNIHLIESYLEKLKNLLLEAAKKEEYLDMQFHKIENYKSKNKKEDDTKINENTPLGLLKRGSKIAFSFHNESRNSSFSLNNSLDHQENIERYSLKERAVSLYNQGFSLDLIAKKLKMDLGEVELIISLQSKDSMR